MPESLQQKVDRMTAGMEVAVTFGGEHPGTCAGPVVVGDGECAFVAQRQTRDYWGNADPEITAIDMPDPEPPFEMGARVLADGDERPWTVTGWAYVVGFGAWMVWLEDDGGISGLSDPEDLTLVPLEPAEPNCPAILVTYTDGGSPVLLRRTWDGKWGRDYNGYQGGDTWTALLNDVATVQALRPAEYLRGGR